MSNKYDDQGGDFDGSHYFYNRDASGQLDQAHLSDRVFHSGFMNSSPYGVGAIPGGQNIPRPNSIAQNMAVSRNMMLPGVGSNIVGGDSSQMGRVGTSFNVAQGLHGRDIGGGSRDGIQFDAANFPLLSASSSSRNTFIGQATTSHGNEDFTLLNEDFPALPGTSQKSAEQAAPVGSAHSIGLMTGGSNAGEGISIGASAASSVGTAQPSSSTASTNKDAKFGLAGLLDVIRMTDRELNILALGSDLTTFGLNLNSADCLFSSFSSPFADQPSTAEPQFTTPSCYMIRPPNLKLEHISKLMQETLFYMFYAMPKDVVQGLAAQELYRREWRYHGELRIWLKARTPQDIMQSHPNIHYVHFDVNSWEVRLFSGPFRGNLAAALLSEEDIRMRLPPIPANPMPMTPS